MGVRFPPRALKLLINKGFLEVFIFLSDTPKNSYFIFPNQAFTPSNAEVFVRFSEAYHTLSARRAPSRFVATLLQGLACLANPAGVSRLPFQSTKYQNQQLALTQPYFKNVKMKPVIIRFNAPIRITHITILSFKNFEIL